MLRKWMQTGGLFITISLFGMASALQTADARNANSGQVKAPLSGTINRPPAATPPHGTTVKSRPLHKLPASSKRPNIIFILTDDLSLNLLQYMPHVIEMKKKGVTFSDYFVSDSQCCPSRSSIFTGRYPHNTGVFTNGGMDGGYLVFRERGNERETFATALSAAGYRTMMLGKYLNGYLPVKHPAAPGWKKWAVAGWGYPEFNYDLRRNDKVLHYGKKPRDYLTDVLSELAVRFIRKENSSPFFIEVATFAPHAPYTPAPRDADAFPGLHAPRDPAFNAAPDANAPQWLREIPPLAENDVAKIDIGFRKRAQSVLAVDKMIGELQAAVAAIGQEKNTYFVFSSDNGLHMGEHRLRPGKMTAFDSDIHVPLIVTGPMIPAGHKVNEIVQNIDLCSTFTQLSGAAVPSNINGRSLVALLHGRRVKGWRKMALIEHHGPLRDRSDPDAPARHSGNPPSYEAIRTKTSVYIEYATGEKEYHDLVTDPHELQNTFPLLSRVNKKRLHAKLGAIKNCRDAKSCSAVERGS